MKAIVYSRYGSPDVLQLKEVDKPVPGDHDVLVRVYASSVNFGNMALVRGKPYLSRLGTGFLLPKYRIPGGDLSGRVEAVGRKTKQFHPGDEVYGDISDSGFGSWAEYVCAPDKLLAPKPAGLGFAEAAAVPQAAMVALQGLRDKGVIRAGQKVLINGASGGIGTFAVQLAKVFGAEVTGVCSTRNLELIRSIGADHTIDYTKEDFSRNAGRYDLILATAGFVPILNYRRALRPGGIYVSAGGSMKQVMQGMMLGPLFSGHGKKMTFLYQRPNREDLILIGDLIESGRIRPVIDRQFSLEESPLALRYYARGHTVGKVVINI